MGMLTDIVVADRADARRVCDSACPSQDFAGLDAKGIDTVKLGKLHAIVTGSEFNPSFMRDALCCSGGEDGPWVFEVPPESVQRLARMTERQLRSAGEKWAATEEFSPRYDTWPSEAVHQFLQDLTVLCRRAEGEGMTVFLWMCL